MSPEILKAYYSFIRDDVRLGAWVFPNGRQVLRIEQIEPTTEKIIRFDELDCIHTAVQDIPVEEFDEDELDAKFYDNVMKLRATERPRVIQLEPEEKFKAFQSWVAGIAEAGMDAFELQTEIEILNQFAYPITYILLKFLIFIDPKFIPTYLLKTEQGAFFQGIRHDSFLISRLLPVCNMLFMDLVQNQGLSESGQMTLAMMININPPEDLFVQNLNFAFLLIYQWEFYAQIIQHHPDLPIQMMLLLFSFGSHREYSDFSIFSPHEEHNPIFIVLNQFRHNLDITNPPQREILLLHFNACENALQRIKSQLSTTEYEVLKHQFMVWKNRTFH